MHRLQRPNMFTKAIASGILVHGLPFVGFAASATVMAILLVSSNPKT
ncbi:MAG TPA: hypothetical protein VIJ19_05185 [Opitutaceae bacterium]